MPCPNMITDTFEKKTFCARKISLEKCQITETLVQNDRCIRNYRPVVTEMHLILRKHWTKTPDVSVMLFENTTKNVSRIITNKGCPGTASILLSIKHLLYIFISKMVFLITEVALDIDALRIVREFLEVCPAERRKTRRHLLF